MNQKGFATLEVIMMVVVIGILATIAVPRFTDVTTKANTAKIQADLSTIDTALQMYFMEQGKDAGTIKDLVDKEYLLETPTPPTGKAYVDGTETDISNNAAYALTTDKKRATLDGNTSGKFSLPKKTNSSSTGGTGD